RAARFPRTAKVDCGAKTFRHDGIEISSSNFCPANFSAKSACQHRIYIVGGKDTHQESESDQIGTIIQTKLTREPRPVSFDRFGADIQLNGNLRIAIPIREVLQDL